MSSPTVARDLALVVYTIFTRSLHRPQHIWLPLVYSVRLLS